MKNTTPRPKTPTAFLISSEPPATTSTASANMPPTTGTRVLVKNLAVRIPTPSAIGEMAPRTAITPENTTQSSPKIVTAICLVNPAKRESGSSSEKCANRPIAALPKISGSRIKRTAEATVPTMATSTGWKTTAEVTPPAAAKSAVSVGRIACINETMPSIVSAASATAARKLCKPRMISTKKQIALASRTTALSPKASPNLVRIADSAATTTSCLIKARLTITSRSMNSSSCLRSSPAERWPLPPPRIPSRSNRGR